MNGPEPEVSLGWNGKTVTARGVVVYFLLAMLAIVSANLYAGWRLEQALLTQTARLVRDHDNIQITQNRTSCILTMSAEQRDQFRRDFRPGAFKQWCPWVND